MTGKHFAYVGKWAMIGRDTVKMPQLGFGIYEFNGDDCSFQHIKDVFCNIAVGSTLIDKKRGILYCTNEIGNHPDYPAGGGGRVFAFAIDPETGDLRQISCQPSFAPLPCNLTMDATGNYLLVVNHSQGNPVTQAVRDIDGTFRIKLEYDDASVVMYPINEDGTLAPPCDILKLTGHGAKRGSTPHPHAIELSPNGDFFCVCDKGADRVWTVYIDYAERKLMLRDSSGYHTAPNSSPRYGRFHPEKPYFFCNNESIPYVCSYSYDKLGNLTPIGSYTVVPEGYDPDNPPEELKHPKHRPEQSDLKLSKDGKFLYDIVRGLDLVEVFEVGDDGTLTRIQTIEVKPGEIPQLAMHGPRGMTITPDGKYLVLASGGTNELVSWRIGKDGKLTAHEVIPVLENPANMQFY